MTLLAEPTRHSATETEPRNGRGDLRTAPSSCPLDCPDACSLEVTVETGDDGGERVAAIGGSRSNPDTAGFICRKVSRFGERLDGGDRLLLPLRRVRGKDAAGADAFARISWDEAIAEITERFAAIAAKSGAEAILPFHYGGSNGLLTEGLVDRLYFHRLGASRLDKTICAATTGAVADAMYGKMPGVGYPDYARARAVVLWGANPKVASIHLVPHLKEAKRRGAFVATVDPQRHFSDAEVDLHLPVLPGTDLPVALALVRRLERTGALDREFLAARARGVETLLAAAEEWPEERAARVAGVPADDLRRLADAYAAADPAVLRVGWGLERNATGGPAVAAVLALPALAGKLGVPGGGYTLSNSRAVAFDEEALLGLAAEPQTQGAARSDAPRTVNMNRLGRLLVDGPGAIGLSGPPVEALFVYNANPAATVPDQRRVLAGLSRDDLFTVVSEQVMTDTAQLADLVLPATTFLEHWDLRISYGSYALGGVRPVVARRGESRPNLEVFGALGRAAGFSDPAFGWSEREAFERVVAALRLPGDRPPSDAERAALAAGESIELDFPGRSPVQLGTVFPGTPDGKIDLAPARLGERPYRYRPARRNGSLALISPGDRGRISSTLGEVDDRPLVLTLHPDDAARRGLAAGDRVRVVNELGEVVCGLALDERTRPGVAVLPKGAWRRASDNGATATALCPATVEATAGGACFNDARVDVSRV